jgi:hypothetical protein
MTPRELAAAARGRLGRSETEPPGRAELERLMDTFPDELR